MSFFKNLFKGNTEKTLIVFDLCNLANRVTDWTFIDKYENPVLLIFYDDRVSDQIKNFDSKYAIVKIALPSDIRQIPSFILGMSLTEFFQEKTYKKMVFAAIQSHYEFVLKSLATRGVSVEFLLLEYQKQENKHKNKENQAHKIENKKKEDKPNENKVKEVEKKKESIEKPIKQENHKVSKLEKSEKVEKQEKTEKSDKIEKNPTAEVVETKVVKEPEIRSLDTKDLTQVCDFFMSKFNIGDLTTKIVLGGYIKQVTGKGYDKIFFTRDYNRFVEILLAAQCIEKTEDAESYKIIKAPTVDIFPKEVEVVPSEDRPFYKKRFHNKRFQKK